MLGLKLDTSTYCGSQRTVEPNYNLLIHKTYTQREIKIFALIKNMEVHVQICYRDILWMLSTDKGFIAMFIKDIGSFIIQDKR